MVAPKVLGLCVFFQLSHVTRQWSFLGNAWRRWVAPIGLWKECFISPFANIITVPCLFFFLLLTRRCNKYPLTRCKVATRARVWYGLQAYSSLMGQFLINVNFTIYLSYPNQWFSKFIVCKNHLVNLSKKQIIALPQPPFLNPLFWDKDWKSQARSRGRIPWEAEVLGRLKQGTHHEFKASQGYMVRPRLKKQKIRLRICILTDRW